MYSNLVSIIIPAYNASKYIEQSIDSILKQTYRNIEVIVVNDGSEDETFEILTTIKDDRLVVINQENKGQCAACNVGFRKSKGAYIKFFDADDILNSNFIEEQINSIVGHKNTIVSAKWGRFFNDDINSFRLNPELVWRDLTPIEWLTTALESGSNMMQCALWLIPRENLIKAGLWDETLSLNNDFEFFVRVLLTAEQIVFSNNSILYYRSGNSLSLSHSNSRKSMESGVKSNLLGCSYIVKFAGDDRVKNACAINLSPWMFVTYMKHRDLSYLLELEIKQLTATKPIYNSNKYTAQLSRLFGWKFVVRLAHYKNWMYFNFRLKN